jgi:hypothetical protein
MSSRPSRWGGRRTGAGRPKRRAIASERHVLRPDVSATFPVRVSCRITAPVSSGARLTDALELARRGSLARTDFRILALRAQAHRIELVVQAHDKVALARGMQGFQVSAARAVNRALRRSGQVFADRYRIEAASASANPRRRSAEPPTPRRRRIHPVRPARGTPR